MFNIGDKIRKVGSKRVYTIVLTYDLGEEVSAGIAGRIAARDASGNIYNFDNLDVIVPA